MEKKKISHFLFIKVKIRVPSHLFMKGELGISRGRPLNATGTHLTSLFITGSLKRFFRLHSLQVQVRVFSTPVP